MIKEFNSNSSNQTYKITKFLKITKNLLQALKIFPFKIKIKNRKKNRNKEIREKEKKNSERIN